MNFREMKNIYIVILQKSHGNTVSFVKKHTQGLKTCKKLLDNLANNFITF